MLKFDKSVLFLDLLRTLDPSDLEGLGLDLKILYL